MNDQQLDFSFQSTVRLPRCSLWPVGRAGPCRRWARAPCSWPVERQASPRAVVHGGSLQDRTVQQRFAVQKATVHAGWKSRLPEISRGTGRPPATQPSPGRHLQEHAVHTPVSSRARCRSLVRVLNTKRKDSLNHNQNKNKLQLFPQSASWAVGGPGTQAWGGGVQPHSSAGSEANLGRRRPGHEVGRDGRSSMPVTAQGTTGSLQRAAAARIAMLGILGWHRCCDGASVDKGLKPPCAHSWQAH